MPWGSWIDELRLHPASAGHGRRGDRHLTASADPKRDALVVVCAISAGIHAALVPGHFAEGTGPGIGFAAAAVLLAALVVGLTLHPERRALVAGAGAVLAGLIASYVLASTTGLPLLHPQPEPVDGLALATKAIELGGLLAAGEVLWRGRPAVARFRLP
jgi:hypothetical protein